MVQVCDKYCFYITDMWSPTDLMATVHSSNAIACPSEEAA